MLVDECVYPPGWIRNNSTKFLENGRASVLHLVKNGVQNDDITQNILFKHVDLVEHNVGIQHEIMWEWIVGIR